MSAPRCRKCKAVVTWSIGLPAWVTFNEEGTVGTIGVDTGELDSDGWLGCECQSAEGPEITEEEQAWVVKALEHLGAHYAPEVDGELP